MEKITNEDLLIYLYKESSPAQQEKIADAIENQWDLREECQMLESTIEELKSLQYSPSESTVNKILEYAKSLETCS